MLTAKTFLGIDCAFEQAALVLVHNQEVYQQVLPSQRQHNHHILAALLNLLQDANIEFSQLELMAFGHGPGSFTGTRLACSVMQGLNLAQEIPVLTLSSMQLAAQTYYLEHTEVQSIGLCLDAKRGQYYYGEFKFDQENDVAEVIIAEQIIDAPPKVHGLDVYLADSEVLGFELIKPEVSPAALIKLIRHSNEANFCDASQIAPVYLGGEAGWK